MNALSRLCLAQLGFDPVRLSAPDLAKRLPEIMGAVLSEIEANRERVELQKSALQSACRYIPNPGIGMLEFVPIGIAYFIIFLVFGVAKTLSKIATARNGRLG